MIPGTVVYDLIRDTARQSDLLRIGHPGGVIDIGAEIEMDGDGHTYKNALIGRTARCLMEGYVLVPVTYFQRQTPCI